MKSATINTLITHHILPLWRAVRRTVQRGKLLRVTPAAAGRIQRLQILGLAGQPRDGVDHAEPYGLAAWPADGAEPFLVANAGDQGQLIAVVVGDPRYHPLDLVAGEICLYAKFGQRVHLKADGSIDVYAPADIRCEGENVTIEAREDLKLRGKRIFRHAVEEDREDVAGLAKGLRYEGEIAGDHVWTERAWTQDAAVNAESHQIQPPEVPVDQGGD